mmetsp:Transcript_95447/g.169464  ORF Transcript_95447/g.169464 Transcript_95447/m.169464 type:complete len:221 (-) Transcript_95447:38-700(-)|eukprot:CAMPEP_0197628624 /NCGR_PEP_ID=MMETSP1338-20131121/6852_1 /TAXON_ID=43686 ORGANISM="Pelagodinium beii, Strain RCC1491" /NCGR_SAMPLE_ID=MMETSP1338 /ASSEMBLY_ACC=CAM_ASM_000754 /LENGTH=220 /DNA_ID=CAMNT_0043199611 /DNA_START=54 /DNA_END=716 /DNA_ORIENTATION=+
MTKPRLFTTKTIPNPDVVHLYLCETGSVDSVDFVLLDVGKGENRKPDYLKLNPLGEVPALVLPDGSCISESIAIVKYLDDCKGSTKVVGTTPQERAETTMWLRRVEDKLTTPMGLSFQNENGPRLKFFQKARPGYIHAELREPALKQANTGMHLFNSLLADGRQYLCGDRFTLADIKLYVMYKFFSRKDTVQVADPSLTHLLAYMDRVQSRTAVMAMSKL